MTKLDGINCPDGNQDYPPVTQVGKQRANCQLCTSHTTLLAEQPGSGVLYITQTYIIIYYIYLLQ